MTKKFVTSVADAYGFDENDNLVLVGKTLSDSSVEVALASSEVRGGRGNAKQFEYFHTANMTITLTDVQWNLGFIANAAGKGIGTGSNIYQTETVTLGAGATGTVDGTPLAIQGAILYGWLTFQDGTFEKVTFTGQNFTSSVGSEDDVVCVMYYELDSAAEYVEIDSNIVPSILRLVLKAQLNSNAAGATSVIGEVQTIIYKAQLTGSFTIAMTADGVSTTPITATALADDTINSGCEGESVYAKIIQIETAANWYDDVIALGIIGGDFGLTTGVDKLLDVRAIRSDGSYAAFKPPVSDLTFASDTEADATVSAVGLVEWVQAGSATIKVSITANTAIDANVVVTTS